MKPTREQIEALKREIAEQIDVDSGLFPPSYEQVIDYLAANGYLKDQSATIDALAGALKLYAYGDWQEGGGVYNTESHEVDFGDKARAALALAGKGE